MLKKWTRRRISERWGMPFWDVVRDLEAQSLNRFQAAAALGMDRNGFTLLLRQHPEHNPWGSPNVVANYVRDTGESFRAALERMAAEGYSLNAASRAIGFAGRQQNSGLRYAMKVRGIEVPFCWRPVAKAKPRKLPRGPNIQKGWPTWEQIYKLTRASPTASVTVTTEQHGVNVT